MHKQSDIIVKIETFRWEEQPRNIWVEITTAAGFTGLGESHYIPGAIEAVIHEMAAPLLIGKDPLEIERHWSTLFNCANFYGFAGAEMRAFSAIDIALWDILGQTTGQPIYNLLGGKVRERIQVYNTCCDAGLYTDYEASLQRPGELAQELLERGIGAMKIFPWDQMLPSFEVTGPQNWSGVASSMGPVGHFLTLKELKKGLRVVEEIRKAVGDNIEIMIEGHSRWDLNSAIKIGKALEPYAPYWMEDMMQPTSPDDLARLASECCVPQAVSERLFTKHQFRQILEQKAARIMMVDVVWTGGLTESKKLASMADTYHLPIAPHDCSGPVTVFASMHLCASATNTTIMETARCFYDGGYYEEVLTDNIIVNQGFLEFPTVPGLGTALRIDFKTRKDVTRRVSQR